MTIRRGTLYAGVFLLAAGAVTLAAAANLIDREGTARALAALWPLAVIAVGVGLVLRRSPAALGAGMVAAALPGLALGASMVAVPDLAIPCTGPTASSPVAETHQGTFDSAARVDLAIACGELTLGTAPGSSWSIGTTDGEGRRTDVTAGPARLAAEGHGLARSWGLDTGRVAWAVVLPTDPVLDLSTEVDGGRAEVGLGGARLGVLDLEVNGGDLRTDLTGASLDRLELEVNAGSARVMLPADSFTGDLATSAGSLRLCAPAELGLRVRSTAALGSIRTEGLVRRGDALESLDYATAPFKAELAVKASVGSVAINPQGGCK